MVGVARGKNLGGQIKAYDEEYEKMPFDLQAGVSKRFASLPFRLSATLVGLTDWDYGLINHLVIGADIILSQQIYLLPDITSGVPTR